MASEDDARIDSVTRVFLFSDLRGYTSFVERHGAASAVICYPTYRDDGQVLPCPQARDGRRCVVFAFP